MPRNEFPIKVALVTHGYNLGGGVPRAARFMQKALEAGNMQVQVFDLATSSSDPNSVRIAKPSSWFKGVKITPSSFNGEILSVGARFSEVEPMRYASRKILTRQLENYDVVVMISGTPCWAQVLKKVKKPTVLQYATTSKNEKKARLGKKGSLKDFIRHAMSPLVNLIDRKAIAIPTVAIPVNKNLLIWTNQIRKDKQRTILIPMGVDTSFFKAKENGCARKWMVSLGRLDETRKGWDRLIQAYGRYVQMNIEALPLRIIGSGELSARNELLIDELHLRGKVSIESNLSDREVLSALQGARIFIQTSLEEGLGLAALEAMACEVPVLCAETDGSLEYVRSGETGYMLPQQDDLIPASFQDGVNRILSDSGNIMGNSARKFCESNFSASRCGAEIQSLVSQLALQEETH